MYMKIHKKQRDKIESVTITAAERFSTTFYVASLDDVINALRDKDANVWLINELEDRGFEAIDFSKIPGSAVIDNNVVICDTDGYAIQIGEDEVDPETAVEDYGLEALSAYVQEATPDVINRFITAYELVIKNVEASAISALEKGISFAKLYEGYSELQ